MNPHPLRLLLDEIHELERRVSEKIQQSAESLPFRSDGNRIHFDDEVCRRHRELVKRVPVFLRESSFWTIAKAPVIYSLLILISMLDLFVTVYQGICLKIYRIPIVRR